MNAFSAHSWEFKDQISVRGVTCYRTCAEVYTYGNPDATALHVKLVFTQRKPGGGTAQEAEIHLFIEEGTKRLPAFLERVVQPGSAPKAEPTT
jgi:hypothetical protein